MRTRRILLAVAIAGCACARTAAAAGGVVNTFQAHALLGSPDSDLYDNRSITLRVRMSLHLGDIGDADDGGGGPFTCKSIKNRFGEKRPCPSPKGRMEIDPANAAPWSVPSPFGDGKSFVRFVVAMHFDGGTECVADAYSVFGIDAAISLAMPGPLVMSGTYVCTRDGGEIDRGVLSLWQQGPSRIRPIVP
jgi:hypothetical protein